MRTRSTAFRCWVLLARVLGTTAILVRVPDRVHAVVKTYDGYDPTVDRVLRPSARAVNVAGPSDLSRRCGRFHVSVVVDRCDCGRDRARRGRHRVRSDYGVSVYVERGRAYFSATVAATNGSRASALGAAERGRHYGPVPVSSSLADGKPVDVIPEKAFMEWAQQEVSSAGHREYVWNRPPADTGGSTEPFRDDREIQVTFSGGVVRRFDRDACLNVGELSSDRLTVDRGGCVLAFDDERCAGAAPRVVVQQPGQLYCCADDDDDDDDAAVVKSVTGCCGRGELDLEPITIDNGSADVSRCDCGDDDIAWSGEPVAARGSYLERFAGRPTRPAGEPQLRRLRQLNARARSMMETAKRAAVSVATEGARAGRVASLAAAADALRAVASIGNRSMEILAAVRLDEPLALSFLEDAVQSADRDVRRAAAATPETAATLVMAAAQTATCVPAFMASSYDGVFAAAAAAATNGPEEPRRRKLREIGRPVQTTSELGFDETRPRDRDAVAAVFLTPEEPRPTAVFDATVGLAFVTLVAIALFILYYHRYCKPLFFCFVDRFNALNGKNPGTGRV